MNPATSRGWIRRHPWLWLAASVALGAVLLPTLLEVRTPVPPGATPSLPEPVAMVSVAPESTIAASPTPSTQIAEYAFWSSALSREMPYTVFLPPGYDSGATRRYPVLYMLHGLGGDRVIEWHAYGIFEEARTRMEAGAAAPMIIVLPEGEGGYWLDHAAGGPAWGTYVAHDLVSEIDGRFRTIPRPQARAVGGNSMGGHGAAQLAMAFPGRFGVVGIHSPTLRDFETAPAFFGDRAYFEAHDPASLMRRYPEAARELRIWMDVGKHDPWRDIVTGFHQELMDLGIPHEFRVLPGPHDDEYWTANLGAYLEFYSGALIQEQPGD